MGLGRKVAQEIRKHRLRHAAGEVRPAQRQCLDGMHEMIGRFAFLQESSGAGAQSFADQLIVIVLREDERLRVR